MRPGSRSQPRLRLRNFGSRPPHLGILVERRLARGIVTRMSSYRVCFRMAALCCAAVFAFSACSKKSADAAPGQARENVPGANGLAPADSGKVTALGKAVDSARAIAAAQLSAGELLKNYTPQLQSLQAELARVRENAAADPGVLAGEAGGAYRELAAQVSELGEMLAALRNYDQDGPTDLASGLQAGFAKAQGLLAQLKARIAK